MGTVGRKLGAIPARGRVAIIYPSHTGDPSIELVEPADPRSPIGKFLERGDGLHHVCYELDRLDETVRSASAAGVGHGLPSSGGCSVQRPAHPWFLTQESFLIEFLERA
jgi:hypothetical protein